MPISDYLAALQRRWWLLGLCTTAALGAALTPLVFSRLIALYGWRRFREGVRTGEAQGRFESNSDSVQRDLEARDGGALYRRGKEWTERK